MTPLVVVRPFQPPSSQWSAGHRGVDLRAGAGTTVTAPHDGVVSFVGMVAGRPVLALDHGGGLRTTYEPVTSPLTRGERVARGAPLGTVLDGTHCADGCLHWGALRAGTYVDPMSLLRPGGIVLLPLP